jgi:hypothetical protein
MVPVGVVRTAAAILAALEWDVDGLPVGWPVDQGVATAGLEVLTWSETTLVQPDGDDAGEPWRWRQSQARYVAWWYAINDEGAYLWRRGQIVLPKGAGKSPMAAALACVELAGPVRFAGWDDDGQPVMRPHPSPDVKLSALSQDQAEDATMGLAISMLDHPGGRLVIPGLDAGLTRVRTRNGKLSSSTARAPSKEGLRPTAVILDEAHLWVAANGGHRLAETLRRGVAKTGSRSLETTNMWSTGQDSVAQRTSEYAEAVRAGTFRGDGVLVWHPVAVCDDLADPVELRAALAGLYADSPWIDIDRLAAEVLDAGTHPADARRYYLNQPASADDAWIMADQWHACLDRDKPLADGDRSRSVSTARVAGLGGTLTPPPWWRSGSLTGMWSSSGAGRPATARTTGRHRTPWSTPRCATRSSGFGWSASTPTRPAGNPSSGRGSRRSLAACR